MSETQKTPETDADDCGKAEKRIADGVLKEGTTF